MASVDAALRLPEEETRDPTDLPGTTAKLCDIGSRGSKARKLVDTEPVEQRIRDGAGAEARAGHAATDEATGMSMGNEVAQLAEKPVTNIAKLPVECTGMRGLFLPGMPRLAGMQDLLAPRVRLMQGAERQYKKMPKCLRDAGIPPPEVQLPALPQCCLCPVIGGAMKPCVQDGLWAHVNCAFWIPEVTFGDTQVYEPVSSLSRIHVDRWAMNEATARLLRELCAARRASRYLKLARAPPQIREKDPKVPEKGIKLVTFCSEHTQKRRMASGEAPAQAEVVEAVPGPLFPDLRAGGSEAGYGSGEALVGPSDEDRRPLDEDLTGREWPSSRSSTAAVNCREGAQQRRQGREEELEKEEEPESTFNPEACSR
eukprot:gene16906-20089_t